MGVELALLEVLRTGTERIHEVAANCGIAFHFTGENGLDVGEYAVEHLGDGDERALEELKVTGGVGETAVGRI